jgi:hypothetical protein
MVVPIAGTANGGPAGIAVGPRPTSARPGGLDLTALNLKS